MLLNEKHVRIVIRKALMKQEYDRRRSLKEDAQAAKHERQKAYADKKAAEWKELNDKIAIEVDGPAHFLPIWGEENLQKRVKSDAIKSGLLLTAGFVVLRIKHITKNLSQKKQRDLLLEIVSIVETVGNKPPPLQDRFIEIEL